MHFHQRGLFSRWMLPFVGTMALILNLLFTQIGHAAPLSSIWSIVASPNVTSGQFANNTFSGVAAISDSDVWAVGFESLTGADSSGDHPLSEHWNGSQWSISLVGTQKGGQFNAVSAVSTNDVWAVGNILLDQDQNTTPLIEHWNGKTWSVVPSPNASPLVKSATLDGVAALSATNAWAVGWFFDGFNNNPLIEHWNGTSWSVVANVPTEVGAGTTFLHAITAISASDIWAVGSFDIGATINLAMHWDGVKWSTTNPAVVTTGQSTEELRGVSAVSSNDVWAVGGDLDAQNMGRPFAIHWNGSKWTQVATPTPPTTSPADQLWAVSAVSTNDVWATGLVGGQAFLEHWNGTSWSVANTPTLGSSSTLFGITRSGASSLWAVGSNAPTVLTTNTLTIHTLAG
jgi:hypothetical protein